MKGIAFSARAVEHVLGESGMKVFRRLVRARDLTTGMCWAGAGRLAGPKGRPGSVAQRTVERAIQAMRRLGLVRQPPPALAGRYAGKDGPDGLGWQTVRVGLAKQPVRVFVRQVMACCCEAPRAGVGGEWYRVPPGVAMRVAEAKAAPGKAHGGARRGAGRPRGGRHMNLQVAVTPGIQVAGKKRSDPFFGFDVGRDASASQTHAAVEGLAHRTVFTSSSGVRDTAERKTEIGTRLGGSGKPVLPTTPMPGVPPYPIIETPRAPHPPLLDADATKLERAHVLATAYRAALKNRFKQDSWEMRKGPLQRSKHYPMLVEAAQLLIDHEIAPAAWCVWSCDIWRDFGGKGNKRKPPPVGWVLGPKRIAERYGWFASEESGYMGGAPVHGPILKELVRRYAKMHDALYQRDAYLNPEEVVAEFFPGTAYAETLAAAKNECRILAGQLQEKVAAGSYIW
jgi:hypothetical protein